jgi:hypothetical protein
MKHSQNTRLFSVFLNIRLYLLTALLSLGIHGQAFASGAKMPDVGNTSTTTATDGTVVGNSNLGGSTTGTSGSGTGSADTGSVTPIADKYSHLDPGHVVRAALLSQALTYFDAHQSTITNKKVISIIDFKLNSSKERLFIIDMATGQVDTYLVAAGKNSDPDHDGFATVFSNVPNSEASSLGYYLTAETYEGGHGYSLMLDGLSSTNSNVRSRAIVIHPADYVADGGRSWGCPAVEPRYSVQIIDQIKGGSIIFASN